MCRCCAIPTCMVVKSIALTLVILWFITAKASASLGCLGRGRSSKIISSLNSGGAAGLGAPEAQRVMTRTGGNGDYHRYRVHKRPNSLVRGAWPDGEWAESRVRRSAGLVSGAGRAGGLVNPDADAQIARHSAPGRQGRRRCPPGGPSRCAEEGARDDKRHGGAPTGAWFTRGWGSTGLALSA
jgi:hypothetical protein